MDVDKCVELHNKILEHGWVHSGKSIEDFERLRQTWFEKYGDDAEAIRDLLSPNLTAPLERAYEIDYDGGHSFFYYVNGLFSPQIVHDQSDGLNEAWWQDGEEGALRQIVLYVMNYSFGSHPMGLVFDQEENTAIMCVDLDDTDTIQNGRVGWYLLEDVLEAWRDMIEKGKVAAIPEADNVEEPWTMAPYSPSILQDTLNIFKLLVQEIESRMPEGATGTRDGSASSPLIDEAVLDAANPQRGFAYHFTQQANRPHFRFIAPSLEIPTHASMTAQPFASFRQSHADAIETIPILLFRFIDGTTPCMAPVSKDECPFGYPFNELSSYPAGLYLSSTSSSGHCFEDESILVLPYRIGARGFARKSDGTRFGENTQDHDEDVQADNTFADLYQPGHQPFTEMHSVWLFSVLENWLGMVQRGDWKVDENGVMGGIEEWKRADTEEWWERHTAPIIW